MAISKVIYKTDANDSGTVWMDTTDKTVTAGDMLSGKTALKADGTTATGNIATKTSSDLTASGLTITAPAGYYASSASKSASDANLVAGNIKKDVSIFGVTGSYEGGGGSTTLKMGVIRPDAELVKSWSDDYYVVDDKGVTIPAYSTTSSTLVAASDIETVSVSFGDYWYYFLIRGIVIPKYSISTKGAGREEYSALSALCEIVANPANTAKALVDNTYYATRNATQALVTVGETYYFTGATNLGCVTYGMGGYFTIGSPTISSAHLSASSLTVKSPAAKLQGNSSMFNQTYWDALTDIRYQYIIELYRVPFDTNGTYGLSGWGHHTQIEHILGNVINNNGTLT